MGVKYVAKKNRVLVGFRERRHPYLAEIDSCIVMHPIVGTKLMALAEMIAGLTIRDKIPQIEVAIGDEQCVLSIRVLEPPTVADKERMRAFGHEHNMSLCLQSKGPDTIDAAGWRAGSHTDLCAARSGPGIQIQARHVYPGQLRN